MAISGTALVSRGPLRSLIGSEISRQKHHFPALAPSAIIRFSMRLADSIVFICCDNQIRPEVHVIRFTSILISATKCPLAVLLNFIVTRVQEYGQLTSQCRLNSGLQVKINIGIYPHQKITLILTLTLLLPIGSKCLGMHPITFISGHKRSYCAVASWLVRSTPERKVRVCDLIGDVVLCSWARHFT